MSLSYSLFKNRLRKTIIDAIYNEIITKTSRYYHWLGKENSWSDFLSPFIPSSLSDIPGPPQNNFRYDLHVRRDILTAKAITASDVSYVVPRVNWESGVTYDIYDDAYTTPIDTAIAWSSGGAVQVDNIIKYQSIYYVASTTGNLGTTPPTHTTGSAVNGSVELLYLTRDTFAYSGATSLEQANFYVLTSEFNVYKCIWNNNDSPSTVMPTTTPPDSLVTTVDGYKWKFMYTIPVALRNRFLSTDWMPVTTALRSQFYTDGEITQVIIDNPGSGYEDGDAIVVSGDGYLADDPYRIDAISIIEPGLGYTATPDITFSDPTVISGSEQIATGTVTISSGSVATAVLGTPAGKGYEANASISVEEPIAFAALWTPSASVTAGDIIKATVTITIADVDYDQDIYYEVGANGELGTVAPTHTTGFANNGSVVLTVVAKRAILTPVLVKTEAVLTPLIDPLTGQITGVIIEDGGIGYTNANLQFVTSTGQGAVLIADFSPGNLNTLQADVELDAIPGTIEVIKVVDPGSGYGSATVQILGDGQGATADAVISSGQLSEVIVTNPGYGYTWTDVRIIGTGTGATARAINSPIYGHGSNAVNELNARSMMFYSSISRDKNQGIEINNDYRKVGLVKNIREFGTGRLFTGDIGSGCILIEGNFDQTKLELDLLLQKDGYKNYRIVDFNSTQILLSVFNNFTLTVGDQLTVMEGTNANYTFTVTKVTERTIDQFSGDLLFLSVREPFAPTAEQIITLRTVITI